MSIYAKFTDHPATVGETYGQHFLAAMGFSLRMLRGAACCALHAVFPFLCEHTASTAITELHERMVTKRNRTQAQRSIEIAH
jgi:Family of unknown function (DUF6356)